MGEILFLAILALILIGPDELPKVARQIGRFLNDIKRTTSEFTNEIKEQAKFDPKAYLDEHRIKDKSDDVPPAPAPAPLDQMSDEEYQKHIGGHHHPTPPPAATSSVEPEKKNEGEGHS